MGTQELNIKWQGKTLDLHVPLTFSIADLKQQIQALTDVPPFGQKLIGLLPKGKLPSDNDTLISLNLNNPHKLMMVGTAKQETEVLKKEEQVILEQREIERQLREEEERRRREEEERHRKEWEERKRLQEIRDEEQRKLREEEDRIRWEEDRRRRLEQEIAMETDEAATLTIRIKAYSSAVANKPEMETTDKVILPPAILEDIISNKLALPLTFRVNKAIQTPDNQTVVHAGVLDFTAPSNTAYLPYWMMSKLGMDEGEEVILTNVKLPKGEFVRLQPHSAEWLDIPEKTRKSVLEFALRGYQSVTVGDTINLNYNAQIYQFDVLEARPDTAISLTDTDVAAEVIQPLQEAQKIHELIQLGETVKGSVAQGVYKYYLVEVVDPNINLSIQLTPTKGDPDLYVSNTQKKPTRSEYIWLSQKLGAKSIIVNQTDPNFSTGNYYIGIHGYKEPSDFSLQVIAVDKAETGHQLKDVEIQGTDTKLCDNCLKQIPTQSFQMHWLNCTRRNFRCPKCGAVMGVEEKEKHLELAHTLIQCDCGVQLEQAELHIHKEYECPLRLVKCLYCPLKIPLSERGSHQQQCGSRTVTCSHCGAVCKRNEIKLHMSRQHDIEIMDITESQELEHFV